MTEPKIKIVEMQTPREIDPVEVWLTKMRDRTHRAAAAIEAAGRVGRAFAEFVEEAGKALRKR